MHQFRVISFDCYGTLVDWQSRVEKLLGAKEKLFNSSLLAAAKRKYEAWEMVLNSGVSECNMKADIKADDFACCERFPDFDCLHEIGVGRKLAILTNASMAFVKKTLSNSIENFDILITSDRTKTYKPRQEHFLHLIEQVSNPDVILHVSAHRDYDLDPCMMLGLDACLLMRHDETNRIWGGMKFRNLYELNRYLKGETFISG